MPQSKLYIMDVIFEHTANSTPQPPAKAGGERNEMNPITQLLPLLDDPTSLDLDLLRSGIHTASAAFDDLKKLHDSYEHELQKELRAKSDLCGGTPTCAFPDSAFSLRGPALLAARREASLRFNELYMISPVSRKH